MQFFSDLVIIALVEEEVWKCVNAIILAKTSKILFYDLKEWLELAEVLA